MTEKKIESGDNVTLNPDLKIIVNNSPDLTNSLSLINIKDIFLNGLSIKVKQAADTKTVNQKQSGRSINNFSDFQNEINISPELTKGINTLKILSGNQDGSSDTVDFILNVNDESSISSLYNYPNPMRSETSFMFDLSGLENPEKCIIKIYTVSGRQIREIEIPANIGFNTVNWDGKDSDGDLIANGTYLYKLSVGGSGQMESEVMKLVVLR